MGLFDDTPHVCGYTNHRFVSRYNTEAPDVSVVQAVVGETYDYTSEVDDILETLTTKKYIGDVCTFCGKTALTQTPQ